ncbi:ATP-binding cassette domain-containing protein [Bacillus sp. JJ1533]|uniref:ABC transporter ATP-binding protein n=1 Tax=Bacillus sp. JJ1533 TaxID=3122959 RepID=UPI003000293A
MINKSQLKVTNLSLNIGGIKILKDISFSMGQGNIIGLVGPNGAGKTTLINCVTCFENRFQGDIYYNGESIKGIPPNILPKYGIVRTFQNLGLFTELSVKDNLLIASHIKFESNILRMFHNEKIVEKEIIELLNQESISPERLVQDLSYGQQKIVEFLCALIQRPKVLVLDEPAAGLSAKEKDRMIKMIQIKQKELGFSLLVIEHDANFVSQLCESVIVLRSGEFLIQGKPEAVFKDKEVIKAWIGESDV